MPREVLLHLLPVPFAAGLVLLATWPWRKRTWPAALALGVAYAVGHIRILGYPPPLLAAQDWVLPATTGAAIVAILLGDREWRWPVRLVGIAIASAALAALYLQQLPQPPWETPVTFENPEGGPPDATRMILWHAGLSLVLFGLWAGLDWRANAVRGFVLPFALWLTASGAAGAMILAHSASLSELVAILSAAMGAFAVMGFLNREQRISAGPYAAAMLLLLVSGHLYTEVLPLSAVALLAAAPLLAVRRWWLTLIMVALAVGLAVWLTDSANPVALEPVSDW